MVEITQPLHGKVALVTGAARGIGRAIALKLARSGCDVAINYYSSHEQARALCDEIHGLGRRAVALQASVAEPDSVAEMFEALRSQFERLDLLISNAASGVLRPLNELTLKHWRWCMETNALALPLLVQQAIGLMPHGSRIVAISSLGAERAIPGYGFVGASKAALESLVRSLAVELGPQGVTVNAVSAGIVDTDALRAFPERSLLLQAAGERTPAHRALQVEDVADAVYLLCLPEAAMINGHTLRVDGGFSIVA